MITAIVVALAERQGHDSPAGWLLAVALLVVVAVNSETLWHARGWQQDGWSGVAPATIYAADYRSARCEEERGR